MAEMKSSNEVTLDESHCPTVDARQFHTQRQMDEAWIRICCTILFGWNSLSILIHADETPHTISPFRHGDDRIRYTNLADKIALWAGTAIWSSPTRKVTSECVPFSRSNLNWHENWLAATFGSALVSSAAWSLCSTHISSGRVDELSKESVEFARRSKMALKVSYLVAWDAQSPAFDQVKARQRKRTPNL